MTNQTSVTIAIDPGASGGIAVMHGNSVEAFNMPDDVELTSFLSKYRPLQKPNNEQTQTIVYMEQVGGYIKGNPAPGSAMFNFGDGFGFIRGLCAAFGNKLVLVWPQVWQKGIPYAGSARTKAERKRAYKEHAGRMYPHLTPTLKTADALCLLHFATSGGKLERYSVGPGPVPDVAKRSRVPRYSEAQAALKWARENYPQHPAPLTGTKEFRELVKYWRANIAAK